LSPYIEYGLQDDLTLGAFGSIDSLEGFSSTRGSNADNTGLSDVSVFARKRLWHNEQAVVSIQPLYKLPSFYSKDDLPRSGTENSDVELRLLGGLNFEAAGQMHYANAEVAYRGRLGDPDDQWLMDATLGLRVDEHWVFMPQLFTTWAVGGAGGGFTQSGADDYDLVKTQLSGLYEFDESWALQGGIYQDVYSRNTGYGTGVVFSLWFRP
jgi:protein XagA